MCTGAQPRSETDLPLCRDIKRSSCIFPTLGQTWQLLQYLREEIEETYPSHATSECCHSITIPSMYKLYTTLMLPSVESTGYYSQTFWCEFVPRNYRLPNSEFRHFFFTFFILFSSVDTVTGYVHEGWGSISGRVKIFLFFTGRRLFVGPTQFTIRGTWVSFSGVKATGATGAKCKNDGDTPGLSETS